MPKHARWGAWFGFGFGSKQTAKLVARAEQSLFAHFGLQLEIGGAELAEAFGTDREARSLRKAFVDQAHDPAGRVFDRVLGAFHHRRELQHRERVALRVELSQRDGYRRRSAYHLVVQARRPSQTLRHAERIRGDRALVAQQQAHATCRRQQARLDAEQSRFAIHRWFRLDKGSRDTPARAFPAAEAFEQTSPWTGRLFD